MIHRVRLVATANPHSPLKPDDLGTLVQIRFDKERTIRILDVIWDSGEAISLIEGEDSWRVFEEDEDLDVLPPRS